MSVKVEVPYQGSVDTTRNQKDTYAYLADVQKAVPATFPGVEKFEQTAPDTYRWVFEKVGYSGYEIQIKLATKFSFHEPDRIDVTPINEPGACKFTGGWTLTPKADGGTTIGFKVHFEIDLPIPFFVKAVAVPLTQKELTKLFDRYLGRVAKALG